MSEIILIEPTKDDEKKIIDYKNEFLINGDSMDGTSDLRNAKTFDEWLDLLKSFSSEETVKEGYVPSTTYLAVRDSDKKLVGMIDVRHRLNENLMKVGGHIGYSVRKTERRKGYAKEMLRLALLKCKELNISNVLVTCNFDNIASAKTIIANGGVLENEVLDEKDGVMVQRYWIITK